MCVFFLSCNVAIAEHRHFLLLLLLLLLVLCCCCFFAYLLLAWLIVSADLFLFHSSSSNMPLSGRSIASALHWLVSECLCVCSYVEYSHYLLNLWMLICINTFTTYFFSSPFIFFSFYISFCWLAVTFFRNATCGCCSQLSVCLFALLFFSCMRFFSCAYYSLIRFFFISYTTISGSTSLHKVPLFSSNTWIFLYFWFDINRALFYIDYKNICILHFIAFFPFLLLHSWIEKNNDSINSVWTKNHWNSQL